MVVCRSWYTESGNLYWGVGGVTVSQDVGGISLGEQGVCGISANFA